jgi:hypothetical protein
MNDRGTRRSRRMILQGSDAVAAGLDAGPAARAGAGSETLALHGGPRSVTCSDAVQRDASRWPRYGADRSGYRWGNAVRWL